MHNVEQMEIFNRSSRIPSVLFLTVAIFVISAHFNFIEVSNKPPPIGSAIAVGVCILLAILTFVRTRLYFDNSKQAAMLEIQRIYGIKRTTFPYKEIRNIIVYTEPMEQFKRYRVAFTQDSMLFRLKGTKNLELRQFGDALTDYQQAVIFAQQICQFAGLGYLDSTNNAPQN